MFKFREWAVEAGEQVVDLSQSIPSTWRASVAELLDGAR
jgi:hypothetical protein